MSSMGLIILFTIQYRIEGYYLLSLLGLNSFSQPFLQLSLPTIYSFIQGSALIPAYFL
jgi:hypothetical protein